MAFPDVSSLFDQGLSVANLMGTFWNSMYDGLDNVLDYHYARNESELQTQQDMTEYMNGRSRFLVPVFRRVRWYPLVIKESEREDDIRLTYNANDQLTSTSNAVLSNKTVDYPLPEDMRSAPIIVDDPINPTQWRHVNLDYSVDIENSLIHFRVDPLVSLIPENILDQEGNITDRQVTVWVFQSDWEVHTTYEQYGYIVNLNLPSSFNSRILTNALWDSMLLGPSYATMDAAIAAICDSPRVASASEQVVDLVTDFNRVLVLTSGGVYVGGEDATAVVSIGQTVNRGDRLFDAYEIIHLNAGLPSVSQLASITLPTSMLLGAYTGGLTFTNALTPLIVSIDGGRTRVEFSLGGAVADTDLFWDTVHALGTAPGATSLAQLLDIRPIPHSGDPDANGLPSFINPMEFLIDNVLAYNAVIIKTKASAFGPNNLGTAIIPMILRKLTPPQCLAMHVQI